jgi:guanylate kinase
MQTKLLGNLDKGLVFVVSAPAGTGKTTLVEMLVGEFPEIVGSVSFTTRLQRDCEIDKIHYNFVTVKEFEDKIAKGDFLEYVKLYDYYYGTSSRAVEELQKQGKHVILVIDTQGALQLKKRNYPATFIFIAPPSREILRKRLLARKTESEAVIEKRLKWADKEIEVAKEYDYCIVNDNLLIAYQALRSVVIAEEYKCVNQLYKKESQWNSKNV